MKGTKKLDYTGQRISVGIDVHKRTWKATFVTESVNLKTVVFERPFVPNLVRYANRNYPNGDFYCVYEAGYSGFWAYHELEKYGFKTIVVNPADIPTSDKDRRNKTDIRDSKKLAAALRSGNLSGIYCPSEAEQIDRSLIRVRSQTAKMERQSKNRIKSLLLFLGIELPDEMDNQRWTSKTLIWCQQLAKQRNLQSLQYQLDILKKIQDEHALILKELRKLSKEPRHQQVCSILQSIPGVGSLTSIKLKLELISMDRFSSTDQLLSYIGLIPNTHSSGDNQRVGKMTKRHKSDLKKTLIEAAWVAIRYDHYLGLKYVEWKKTKGANKAIIKVAVKLVRILRHLWKHNITYKPVEI